LDAFAVCGFSRVTVSLVLNSIGTMTSEKVAQAVNLVDHDYGETALHYAARHGYASSIELLLEVGVDPTIRNVFSQTATDLVRMQGWDKMESFRMLVAQASPSHEVKHNEAADTVESKPDLPGTSAAIDDRNATGGSGDGGWLVPSDLNSTYKEDLCDSNSDQSVSAPTATPDSSRRSSTHEYAPELLADLNTDGCTTVDYLDWTTFERQYRSLSRPVLVRHPAADGDGDGNNRGGWRAWDRWQRAALRSHYGSIQVSH
jgi:hypothetical protein